MNQNSIESHYKCIEEGLYTKKNKSILTAMVNAGAVTGSYIDTLVPGGHKRLKDLQRMGAIEFVGKVWDPITKRKVDQFRIAEQMPLIPVKGPAPEARKSGLEKMLSWLITERATVVFSIGSFTGGIATAYDLAIHEVKSLIEEEKMK